VWESVRERAKYINIRIKGEREIVGVRKRESLDNLNVLKDRLLTVN